MPRSLQQGPAEQGQLLILASGPESAVGPLRPVFDAIGRKAVWLGGVGQGSIVKLVVNAYLSILIEGVAETMELADRLGISHQQLADVIVGGPLDAPLAEAKLHKMDRGDYTPEFPLEWAPDLRNALGSWELNPCLRGDAVGDRAVVAGDGGRGVVNLVDDHGEGAGDAGLTWGFEDDGDRGGGEGDGSG
jgi:hypothetical protein